MSLSKVIIFAFLLFNLCFIALCQEEGEAKEVAVQEEIDLKNIFLPNSPDADTTYIFPDNSGFHAGVPSTVVVGFKNNGQRTFSFNSIRGTLYYNVDYNYQLENYTKVDFGVPIRSGEEYSFSYTFTLNPMLVEGEYGLEIFAFYNDEFGNYSTSIYNETITILEPEDTFDIQDVFQLSFVVAIIALLVFGAYNLLTKGKKRSYTAAVSQGDDDDWLAGTSADKNKKRR